MKTRIALLLIMLITPLAWADDDVGALSKNVRIEMRTQKMELMKASLRLTEEQGEKFWPIYEQYDLEHETVLDERFSKITYFVENYDSMTESTADKLALEMISLDKKRASLRGKYYKKVRRALGGIQAARFVQVDRQVNVLIDVAVMRQVPLIASTEELGTTPAK
ncbi:MAG: hypothetical protein V7711_00120 [Pseudomonadales bacterium]